MGCGYTICEINHFLWLTTPGGGLLNNNFRILIAISVLLVGIMLFSACSSNQTATQSLVPTEPVLTEAPTQAPVQPTAVVSQEPTTNDAPLVFVASVPTGRPVVDTCMDCHSDKQRLIDTAKPEVVVESESSGEG